MIGIIKALADASRDGERRVELDHLRQEMRDCPFCESNMIGLEIDEWRDSRWPKYPSRAMARCSACGSTGPAYALPLAVMKTDPPPAWDPCRRAVDAWNGKLEVDGLYPEGTF